MTPEPSEIDRALPDLARRVARRLLGEAAAGDEAAASTPRAGVHAALAPPRLGDEPGADGGRGAGRALVGVEALGSVPDGGELAIAADALVTPLARDEADRRGIRLTAGRPLRVAIGADHGGFELKRALLDHLRRRGLQVHDLGTHDRQPVDYPDLALAVATEVATGRAEVGVCVDGAGIGSAMAANKVAGVRAANCSTAALARNAREHNHANLLTLGAGHLDARAASEVLDQFLATPFGPGRHARRVAMIDALDARPTAAPNALAPETTPGHSR